MATYAIGDIQGCFDELQQLLKLVGFDENNDVVWFTGDLVNRGPKSLETLRFVKALGDRAITVLGNHDLHLLALAESGKVVDETDSLYALMQAEDRDELLYWLRQQPLLHHDEGLGYTMVHAGLLPQWDLEQAGRYAAELERVLRGVDHPQFFSNMYGNKPDMWRDDLEGWDRLRVIVNSFTRLRYCDAKGRMAMKPKGAPGGQSAGLIPWFTVPGRKTEQNRLLFGHWSTLGLCREHNVFGLDTGCLWGGQLTAMRLEDSEVFGLDCQGACSPGEE